MAKKRRSGPLRQKELDRRDIVELARALRDSWSDEDSLEIDDHAKVSYGTDNGAYVQAWLWVSFDGTKFDREKGSV